MPLPKHHMIFKKRQIPLSPPSISVTPGKVSGINPTGLMPFALLHSLMLPTFFPAAEGWVGTHPSEEQGTAHPKITLTSFCRAAEAREAPGPRASSCPTTRREVSSATCHRCRMRVSLLFASDSLQLGCCPPRISMSHWSDGRPCAQPALAPGRLWGPGETRAGGTSLTAHPHPARTPPFFPRKAA